MPSKELEAARDAAEAAAVVIRSLYQKNLQVTTKADATPVTEADVRAEEAIRSVLSERFPDYGFYGEETGQHALDAQNVWLVDPIDGTKSFVRDCPFFSTQIALMREGRFVLGVSSAPAYGELATFPESSIFIGAYIGDKLIGFIKMTYDETLTQANMMNIVSMMSHRDKAPTNALIAQAVRSCAERGIKNLVYQSFSYGKKLSRERTKKGYLA